MGVAARRRWLACAFLLALAVRCWGAWDYVRPDGCIRITDPDACQHLRRIEQTLANYPWTPAFDRFSNHPYGSICPWAPLLDFGVATLALVAGWGHPSRALCEWIASCLIPLLGALAVVPVGCVAWRLFGEGWVARAAPIILAILPGHVLYSLFGRVDHHVLEALFVALLIAVQLRLADAAAWRGLDAALLAGCLTLLPLAWHGFPLYLAIFFAAAHVPLWAARHDAERRVRWCALHAWAFGGLTVMLFIMAQGSEYWQRGIVAYEGLSSVHLMIAGAAAAYFAGLAGLARRCPAKPGREFGLWAMLWGVLIAKTCALWLGPQVGALLGASEFREIGVNRLSSEGQPLFALAGMWPRFATPAAWVLPAVGVLTLVRAPAGAARVRPGVALVWAVGAWAAAGWVSRFVYVMAVPLAWLAPALADLVGGAVAGRARPRRRVAAIVAVLVALLWLPASLTLSFVDSPSGVTDELYDFLDWIRDHTPPVRDVADGEPPEYCIAAPWTWGNHLKYVAHRPVVADNLGYGLEREAKFEIHSAWGGCSSEPAVGYVLIDRPATGNPRGFSIQPIRLAERLAQDGSEVEPEPGTLALPLPHIGDLRLVVETRTPAGSHPCALALYQRVKSAEVRILHTPIPLGICIIRVDFITNVGRKGWLAFTALDRFSYSVPYATRAWNGAVHVPGPYLVKDPATGRVITTFEVTEQEVIEGRTVTVSIPEVAPK
ncbi:MAG: hypothetical protein HZA54_16005 [Planctomycetes bacterium]|nr:hypothetical protein [Planctomycetota bacterium]